MNKYFKKKKIIIITLLSIVALWAVFTLFDRIKREIANKKVEICMDWDEIVNTCYMNDYSLEDFLLRCKTIGISSIAINETNIEKLSKRGKLIFLKNADFYKFRFLDMFAPYTKVKGNTFFTRQSEIQKQVLHQMTERYKLPVKKIKIGQYKVIEVKFKSGNYPSYWNNRLSLGFLKDEIEFIKNNELNVILRPQNLGDPSWIKDQIPENLSGFMCDGKEVPGYPEKIDEFTKLLIKKRIKVVNMEFVRFNGFNTITRTVPELCVLGHTITTKEINKISSTQFWLARWKRAVKERNVRFLFVHINETKNIEETFDYLRSLAKTFRSSYKLESSMPPMFPFNKNLKIFTFFAFLIAIIFPPLSIYFGKTGHKPLISFFNCVVTSTVGGILISSLLYDYRFMQKLVVFPYIKLSMLIPFFISVFIVFKINNLKNILSIKLQIKHLIVFGFFASILALLVLRTGNYSTLVLKFEYTIRQLLENYLFVRPRTKEFLFGHPLLFLGFYYRKNAMIWLGVIGQISIINTFIHMHTPFTISLIRTINGLWLGLLIAYIIVFAIKYLKPYVSFKRL